MQLTCTPSSLQANLYVCPSFKKWYHLSASPWKPSNAALPSGPFSCPSLIPSTVLSPFGRLSLSDSSVLALFVPSVFRMRTSQKNAGLVILWSAGGVVLCRNCRLHTSWIVMVPGVWSSVQRIHASFLNYRTLRTLIKSPLKIILSCKNFIPQLLIRKHAYNFFI